MAAISKQLEELLLLLRSKHLERENLQVDSISTSPQLPESTDFNRPEPKPNYVINATADVTKASSPLSNRTIKCHRRISLEEIEERRLKGLCMFCEELETPDHHLLHKKSGLLVVECEDLEEREVEVSCQSQLQLQEDLQSPDVLLEEKSVPQFQVPIANSEILKSIEPEEVDLGLENLEYVVMNENLEQEWVQRNVDKRFEVDGDVEKGQKVISNTKIYSAHQMFGEMSQHQERLGIKKKRKWFKSWMFKYKREDEKLHALTFSKNMRMVFSQHLRMFETSSDLLMLNGNDNPPQTVTGFELDVGGTQSLNQERHKLCAENKGCLGCSQALVLMNGITNSSSRAEELMKEEPDFVRANEVKMEKQIVDREMSPLVAVLETVTKGMIGSHVMIAFVFKEIAISYYQCIEHNLFSTMLLRLQSKKKQRKGHKSWMFKYKFDEEDRGLLQSRTGWTQEEPAVIRFLLRRHLHLHFDCEEPELAGRKRNHGLFIRLHSKQKQRKRSKCWMFKFKMDSKPAANWSPQMHLWSTSYRVWHRWKARYSQNFDSQVWDPGGSK